MTTPAVKTVRRMGSRFYVHPLTKDKVPSVTSIGGMLPKRNLMYARGKAVADEAVNSIGTVVDLVTGGNPSGAVDFLERAPARKWGAAAQLGTDIHGLVEKTNRGEDVGPQHPDHQAFLDQYAKFLDAWQPEFLEVEATLWNHTLGYAGTCDGLCRLDGEIVVWDLKTGASGVWPETALQMCGYANAEVIVDPDGTERPMPEIEGAVVLHLRPENFEVIPVRLGSDVFGVFRHLLGVLEWETEISKTVLGKPVEAT